MQIFIDRAVCSYRHNRDVTAYVVEKDGKKDFNYIVSTTALKTIHSISENWIYFIYIFSVMTAFNLPQFPLECQKNLSH